MFVDDRINQCEAFGFTGGPTFRTLITSLRNEREIRNGEWAIARHVYGASYLNIGVDGMKEVRRMFYVCRGRLHSFRFTDPVDHDAANVIFGVGDGVTSIFQLSKPSEADGIIYRRQIALPVTPSVTVNAAPSTPDIDLETGEVDFGMSPPGMGEILRWSAVRFDVKVRFDQDELPFSLDNPDAMNGSVNLIEVLDGQ